MTTMPLRPFTEAEWATLARFDAAPSEGDHLWASMAEAVSADHALIAEAIKDHPALQVEPDGPVAETIEGDEPELVDPEFTEQPLARFIMARIQDTESVLERIAQQKHLQWVEPFTAERAARACHAERTLLVDHLAVHSLLGTLGVDPCDCHLLRCMAWPNNDHPDWRAEWAI